MEGEDDEEWMNGDDLLWTNPDFLAQLTEAENRCRSVIDSSNPSTAANDINRHPLYQQSTVVYYSQLLPNANSNTNAHSPPRQLFHSTSPACHSRVSRSSYAETEKEKLEGKRVSNQRNDVVRCDAYTSDKIQCTMVKKTEESKEEYAVSLSQPNDINFQRPFTYEMGTQPSIVNFQNKNKKIIVEEGNDRICVDTPPSCSVGVQTEEIDGGDYVHVLPHGISAKLKEIWGCRFENHIDRTIASQLLSSCAADFQALSVISSKITSKNHTGSSVCITSFNTHETSCNSDAARISSLYSVLTQINDGISLSEALFGPLLDLCDSENVSIVYSTLHILHYLHKHLLGSRINLDHRDNVKVESAHSQASKIERASVAVPKNRKQCSHGPSSFESTNPWNIACILCLPDERWLTIFRAMTQTGLRHNEERVRLEAVSIMRLVLIAPNTIKENAWFCEASLYSFLAQLLKKPAASHVRIEALRLLRLLLICPKVVPMFRTCSDEDRSDESNAAFDVIEGVADCVTAKGDDFDDIELRRRAISTLALLFSSGKSGFEILISCKIADKRSLFGLILEALLSEIDSIAANPLQSTDRIESRTMAVREGLILVNRLISSPVYSSTVMRLMVASRDMATLALNITSSSCRINDSFCSMPDPSMHRGGAEIVDFIKLFRKRVYAFLGLSG